MTTKWAGWIVAALALAALAAGAVYAASHSAEVRITARQLEDGRVEFALQQRVDGEWGERQLPRSRFFPDDAQVGRWLNSSPLTVSVESGDYLDEQGDTPPPATSATRYQPQRVAEGNTEDGSLIWSTADTEAGFSSFLAVQGRSSDGLYDKAVVYIACDHDAPDARVHMQVGLYWHVLTTNFASDFDRDRYAGYRLGGRYDDDQVLGNTDNNLVTVNDSWVWLYGDNLLEAAKQKRWLVVSIPRGYDEWTTATFDLSGAWGTPVQRNLDNCGR